VFVLFESSWKCSRRCPMFTRQREEWADSDIIALVEFDMKRMRVRIVFAPEAIGERLRELQHPRDHHREHEGIEHATDDCGLDKMRQARPS